MFDVYYYGHNNDLTSQIPIAKKVDKDIKPNTRMYWVIDADTTIVDTSVFDYRPTVHDQNYRHIWHSSDGQYLGIQLVPKKEETGVKKVISQTSISKPAFPVVEDATKFFSENEHASYVWQVDPNTIVFDNTVFNFRPDIYNQGYRYILYSPSDQYIGIQLIPREEDKGIKKIVSASAQTKFPVVSDAAEFFANDDKTTHVWQVTADYDILSAFDFTFVPDVWDQSYRHTWYYKSDQHTGIELIPREESGHKKMLFTVKRFPVVSDAQKFFANNPDITHAWQVDADVPDFDFSFVPDIWDRNYRHIWYSNDNKYLGVQLIPRGKEEGIKNVFSSVVRHTDFPIVTDHIKFFQEDTTTTHVWVVDDDVEVLTTFDFSFVPDIWDKDKTHVWQKINPLTQLPYDYSGVKLVPRNDDGKRSKYVRQPACRQKQFPVHTLTVDSPLITQLEEFDSNTDTRMYWVVDPWAQLDANFDFSFYPTQWDADKVHVFADDKGKFKNVRLYPKDTFVDHSYTELDVLTNSFDGLKQINTVASRANVWPVIEFTYKTDFVKQLAAAESMFVWTVDSDVDVVDDITTREFVPEFKDSNKVHVWQRLNPHTNKTHSYGGLRLWPTFRNYDELTTENYRLNKIKQLNYVKAPGCSYKPYSIVLISYYDDNAQDKYDALVAQHGERVHWVRDVDGIFNAHRAAASAVDSKMFWVVDNDAEVVDDFDFSYIPDQYDQDVVHVWHSLNPVTGDEYGYGGVKLFPRQAILNLASWGLDFTTGVSTRLKVIPDTACVTRFNTDPYNAWKSAFREAVKLTLNGDDESLKRLEGWLNPITDADFAEYVKAGAEMGQEYAALNTGNTKALDNINDYKWLHTEYTRRIHF